MDLTPIEATAIDAHRTGSGTPRRTGDETADWIGFGLTILLDAAQLARASRLLPSGDAELKTDGSPVTQVETEIEARLTRDLSAFDPAAVMVGEESGGELPESGLAVAIDPIDGTWAYLGGTETYASTLAFFRDGSPFLGMIASPVTGEIGYAPVGGQARVVRLSLFGEPDAAFDLPEGGSASSVLVNVHPSRAARQTVQALYDGWA